MNKIIIGICSVGSGVGQSVVDSCRFFRKHVRLIGLGNNPLAYGAYDCDEHGLIPSYYDNNYLEEIENAIQHHGIQVLIPGHDDEALILAKNHERIRFLGAFPLVSSYDLIRMCRQKSKYADCFHETATYFVKTYHPDEIEEKDFPIIRKPEQGFASHGITIINDKESLEACKGEPGYIYQEIAIPQKEDQSHDIFLSRLSAGNNLQVSEISIQLIFNQDSNLVQSCATYNTLKDGVPIEIAPYSLANLTNFIESIKTSLERLKAFGPINIQGRMTDHGFKVFEINPRFTGITGLRAKLGFNEVEYCILSLLYNIETKKPGLSDNYMGVRQFASKKVLSNRVFPEKGDKKVKNILITGASGMLGREIVGLFTEQGHNIQKLSTNAVSISKDKKSFSISDLKANKLNLSDYQLIIHLGFARPGSSEEEIYNAITNSIDLINQAAQSGVDHFIFISSQSVYGFSEKSTFSEEMPVNPQSGYARGKAIVEKQIESTATLTNETRFSVLRLASVMSPSTKNIKHEAYSSMFKSIMDEKDIILSTPARKLSKIDIRDAIDAIAYFSSTLTKENHDVINIGPIETLNLHDSLSIFADTARKPKKFTLKNASIGENKNLVISSVKAHKMYGWKAKNNLKETALYFKKHFEEMKN